MAVVRGILQNAEHQLNLELDDTFSVRTINFLSKNESRAGENVRLAVRVIYLVADRSGMLTVQVFHLQLNILIHGWKHECLP